MIETFQDYLIVYLCVFCVFVLSYCYFNINQLHNCTQNEYNRQFASGCIGAFILIYCCFSSILIPSVIYIVYLSN